MMDVIDVALPGLHGRRRNQQIKQKQKLKKHHNFATVLGDNSPPALQKQLRRTGSWQRPASYMKMFFKKGDNSRLHCKSNYGGQAAGRDQLRT
jgi:hypothetical protein